MATISSAGIGSGLDINGIITKLMDVERQPLAVLDQKEASYQAKLSAFGSLKGAVSTLQSAAGALEAATLYSGMSASSSDSGVLTASANSAASTAVYAIQVVDKAQAQSISSQGFGSLTSDISAIDGKLKIELGTYDSGLNTFTPDPDKTAVTIDIAAAGSSLEEVRDAINAADAGVRANIVYVGSAGYKLTLTSNDTGAESSLRLTALDSGGVPVALDNTNLAKLSFDPTQTAGAGKEFDVNVEALDAHIKIDGLDIYRATNTVSDAVTGVTLTLAGTGSSTLTIGRDTTAVRSAFDAFVKAYNDANKALRDLTAYNASTGQGSVLTGDSGARSLQTELRGLITASRTVTSGPRNLSDLGIAMQRDGSLQFNSTTLTDALADSPDAVSALMTTTGTTNNDGLAVRMGAALDSILASGGLLASRSDGITRSISDIDDRREVLARRLTAIEKRYRAQFTALDTLVASMQSTSKYLEQQLASLSTLSSSG